MKVVVWGVGKIFSQCLQYIDFSEVECIIDNNSERWGSVVEGIEICRPQKLQEYTYDYIVITSTKYYSEIKTTLETKYNVQNDRIISLDYYLFIHKKGLLCNALIPLTRAVERVAEEYQCSILDVGGLLSESHFISKIGRINIDVYGNSLKEDIFYRNKYLSGSSLIQQYQLCLAFDEEILQENLSEIASVSDRIWLLLDYDYLVCEKQKKFSKIINVQGYLFGELCNNQNKKTIIYEISHKKFRSIPSPDYIPLYVRHVEIEDLSDSKLFADVDDHISELNSVINECTAIYWIWKNQQTDYIAINHYRRFFVSQCFGGCLQSGEIELIMNRYDGAISELIMFSDMHITEKLRTEIDEEAFEVTMSALRNVFDELEESDRKAFNYVFDGNSMFPCNMFIMRCSELNEYCKWLFDILFKVIKCVEIKDCWDSYSKRVIGFFAERLLTVWVVKKKLKLKELPIVFVEQ